MGGKITHISLGLISRSEESSFKFFIDPVIHMPYSLNDSVWIFAVFWGKSSNVALEPEWDVL